MPRHRRSAVVPSATVQTGNSEGATEISERLTWLATNRRVIASTQNQALSAVLFLYREVLHVNIGPIEHVPRARMPARVPVVLSRDEVARIMKGLDGVTWMIFALLYGAGLRLAVIQPPSRHLDGVRQQHLGDPARGFGRVVLPFALDRKYPNAAAEWGWQFVFPASRVYTDSRWGPPTRFHLHESVVQKAVAHAARQAGIAKRAAPHTFRHSFATHLLRTATTFGRCRSCSVTPTSARRWCIRMC